MEIDLSNYINLSGYDMLTIVNYIEGAIFNLSSTLTVCTILGITGYSIVVGIYRNQRKRGL